LCVQSVSEPLPEGFVSTHKSGYLIMVRDPASSIQDCVLVDAHVVDAGHYTFAAHSEKSLIDNVYLCRIVEYREGRWSVLAEFNWQAVGIAVRFGEAIEYFILGRDGQFGSLVGHDLKESIIDPQRPTGPFRGLRIIGGSIFAFGMKREVYRRNRSGVWERMTQGMETPLPQRKLTIAEKVKLRTSQVGGVNAMTTDELNRLLAVGMRGEIWRMDENNWFKLDSPTNLMLKDAVRTPDNTIFVCGQAGTVIRGTEDTWEIVTYEGPQSLDFASIAWFNGMLYLADGHSLRTLADGELRQIDFGVTPSVPCALVVAGPTRVLSVAGQEVWESADGNQWSSILG
jgi:hypothetical protein